MLKEPCCPTCRANAPLESLHRVFALESILQLIGIESNFVDKDATTFTEEAEEEEEEEEKYGSKEKGGKGNSRGKLLFLEWQDRCTRGISLERSLHSTGRAPVHRRSRHLGSAPYPGPQSGKTKAMAMTTGSIFNDSFEDSFDDSYQSPFSFSSLHSPKFSFPASTTDSTSLDPIAQSDGDLLYAM